MTDSVPFGKMEVTEEVPFGKMEVTEEVPFGKMEVADGRNSPTVGVVAAMTSPKEGRFHALFEDMAVQQKRARVDNAATQRVELFGIPGDVIVSMLLFLDIKDVCAFQGISTYSEQLSLSSLQLTKTTTLDFDKKYIYNLTHILKKHCRRLSCLHLVNKSLTHHRDGYEVARIVEHNPNTRVTAKHIALSATHELIYAKHPCEELWFFAFHTYHVLNLNSHLKRLYIEAPLNTLNWEVLLRCQNLEELLVYGKRSARRNIAELAECNPKLRSLCLENRNDGCGLPLLPGLDEFQTASATHTLGTIVASMPKLTSLHLNYFVEHDYQICDLPNLRSFTRLQTLHIHIKRGLEVVIRNCTALRTLKITYDELAGECDLLQEFLVMNVEGIKRCRWEWFSLNSPIERFDLADLNKLVMKIRTLAPNLLTLKLGYCGHVMDVSNSSDVGVIAPWIREDFLDED